MSLLNRVRNKHSGELEFANSGQLSAEQQAIRSYRQMLLEEVDLDELSKYDATQRRIRLERVLSHLISQWTAR